MISSRNSELSVSGRALWRASIGLLLLCGLVGWSGASTPADRHGAEKTLLHSQERQLEWARGFENLFARPAVRKHGELNGPDAEAGGDGPALGIVGALAVLDYYRVIRSAAAPQAQQFPLQALHLLPAPRGPPSHA